MEFLDGCLSWVSPKAPSLASSLLFLNLDYFEKATAALFWVMKADLLPRTENIFQQFTQQHAFSLPLFAAPSSSFLSRGLLRVDLFEDFSGAVVRMASTIFRPVRWSCDARFPNEATKLRPANNGVLAAIGTMEGKDSLKLNRKS